MRQQKAFEKADAVVNKLERKVEGSKARARKVQERAKDWEALNQEGSKPTKATTSNVAANGSDDIEIDESEVMEDAPVSAPTQDIPKSAIEQQPVSTAQQPTTAVERVADIDEIT